MLRMTGPNHTFNGVVILAKSVSIDKISKIKMSKKDIICQHREEFKKIINSNFYQIILIIKSEKIIFRIQIYNL